MFLLIIAHSMLSNKRLLCRGHNGPWEVFLETFDFDEGSIVKRTKVMTLYIDNGYTFFRIKVFKDIFHCLKIIF